MYGQRQQKRLANIIIFKSSDPKDFFEQYRYMNCNIYKLEANVSVCRPSSEPQMFCIAVHMLLKKFRGIAQ